MKPKKYPAKFFHELIKTTYADQYIDLVRRHNWVRKLEWIKKFPGGAPEEGIWAETLGGNLQRDITIDEFVEETSAWSYAAMNYFRHGEDRSDDVASEMEDGTSRALYYTESVVKWFLVNAKLTTGFDDEESRAVKALHINHWKTATEVYDWEKYNRPSYVLSPDLAEMLQYTKLDQLPVEDLRLPYPTLVLAPPERVMRELFGKGNCLFVKEFISESGRYSWRVQLVPAVGHVTPLGVFAMDDPKKTVAQVVEAAHQESVEDERVFQQRIRDYPEFRALCGGYEFLPKPDKETLRRSLLFVCSCMVYATMSDADIILASDSPEYKAWAASLARYQFTRKERSENEIHKRTGGSLRFYLGRQIKIIDRHTIKDEDGYEERVGHASPRLHWRSGHYRRSWHGSGEDKHTEIHWIKPTLVGVPQGGNVLERRAGMR